MKKTLLNLTAILGLTISSMAQNVIYVDIDASGNNDGSTWANAYDNLSSALASASINNEIWVAEGTYKPTTSNRSIYFSWTVDSLKLYGGFDGTETILSERDIEQNVTTLSGDIGVSGDSTDNSQTVLRGPAGSGANTYNYSLVSGFTISDGFANGSSNESRLGGGVYIDHQIANFEFSNCTFQNNIAEAGGAISIRTLNGDAGITLNNCKFIENKSRWAAGMNISAESGNTLNATIANCLFDKNEIIDINGVGLTAVIYAYSPSSEINLNLLNSTIVNSIDTASGTPTADKATIMYYHTGTNNAEMHIHNTLLWRNDAQNVIAPHFSIASDLFDTINVVNCISEATNYQNSTLTNVTHTYPMFKDTANGDFSILTTSPAKNAGSTSGIDSLIPDTDLAGNVRISEGVIDIGCYEYHCPQSFYTDVQTAINSFTWIDGNTYTSSNNTATHTLTNTEGCDSIITLNLTIETENNIFDSQSDFINIHPNPTTEKVVINIKENLQNIRVFDFTGRTILKNQSTNIIDLSDFENGIYFIEIETYKNKIIKRVVKQ